MIKMKLSELATPLTAHCHGQDTAFQGLSTDTRTITAGNLFIAIRGEQFDGHTFVIEAHKKGASAALVDHKIEAPIPQIIVKDTIAALGKLSALWRNQFSLPLIGVTGSNGKTTLKNMLASILSAACQQDAALVLATEGNLNNNIGMPLMLARLNKNHRYAVIEMGMNHFGEIEYLTKLAKPTVTVITNAAQAHLEGVNDIAGVAKAKGEIFLGLDKKGIAILNRDDSYFDYWRDLVKQHQFLTFGLKNPADVTATISKNQMITLHTPKGNIEVALPLLGTHNVMNALAATAAALAINIDLSAIKHGLENISAAPGRMRQYFLKNNIRIIDDTYNANPSSLQAAVNTLATFDGKKILVLGDMKELGPKAKEMHFNTGQKIREAGIDYLFTFGNLSAATTEAFGENAQHFTEREKMFTALQPHLKNNATILIKGSRSMQMEKIVNYLVPRDEINGH